MVAEKKSRMVLGFNHNIKHKGRIYHVQTEDSGVDNPHIITHLFVGGNILATKKTSYADIVAAENLEEIVRELMQEQHKAMLRNLVNGVYDDLEVPGVAATELHQGVPPMPEAPAPAPPEPTTSPEAAPPPATPTEPGRFPVPSPPERRPPPRTQVSLPRHEAPTLQAMPAARAGAQVYQAPPDEKVVTGTVRKPVVLRAGTAKKVEPAPAPEQAAPTTPEPAPAPAAAPTTVEAGTELPPEVVAARRLAEKPIPRDTSGPTIFGENLITEKSLDEVILSYLSGEEEGG